MKILLPEEIPRLEIPESVKNCIKISRNFHIKKYVIHFKLLTNHSQFLKLSYLVEKF